MVELVCISLASMTPAPIPKETIVCLGNFDGVHLAHRALLQQATSLQKLALPNAARCVFSFFEPSWTALSHRREKVLSTQQERLEHFRDQAIEYAILCDFTAIREYSPERFAKEILLEGCHCVGAVCGFNYRFGKFGAGTPEQLQTLLKRPVTVQNEVVLLGETVSSTRIRSLLAQGDVKIAAALLGEAYSISGPIVHGKALGKQIGFPTINQELPANKAVPRNGVYLTECRIDGTCYYGVTNIGTRPTVETGTVPNCETHLLGVCEDFYGKHATVSFLEFLRPEQKFASLEALCSQLKQDVATAQSLLNS